MHVSTKTNVIATLLLLIALSLPAFGQTTYTWSGSDTTWSTASAWSPSGIPGATDTVVISAGIINTDSDVSVGGILQSGGIFRGSNALTVTGRYNWTGGRLEGSGSLSVSSGATFTIGDLAQKIIDGWTLNNNTNATWSDDGDIRIEGGGSFSNASGATFTIQNAAAFDISTGGGSVVNNGTFTKTATGQTVVELPFTNNGTFNVNSGSLQMTGGTSHNGATYNTGVSTTVEFRDNNHTLTDVALEGSGAVNFTTGAIGTVGGTNGLTSAAGVSVAMNGSDTKLDGTGPITVNGNLDWNREEIAGSGNLTINGTMTISGGSSRTLSGRTLVNNGTVTWTGGGNLRLTGNANINNVAGSTFEVQSDAVLDFLDPNGGTFTNAGTFTRSAGSGNFIFDVAFDNSGTLNLNSGNIRLTRGGTNSGGTYSIQSGRMLEFDGNTHTLDNMSFPNSGTIQISSNTVSINGAGVTIGATTVLNLNAGTLNGNGPINVDGTLNWNGGFLSGSGLLSINNVMNISGNNDKTIDTRSITNNGTINWSGTGAVELDNGTVFTNASTGILNMQDNNELDFVFPTGGSFINNGIVNRSSGFGEALFDVPVENHGTINLQTGTMSIARGSSGTTAIFDVSAGTTLEFSDNSHTYDGITLNGNGTVQARDEATMAFNGTGLNITSGITFETFAGGTTVGGTGPILVDGTYNWNRGTITGAAAFTVNGLLSLSGTSSRDLDGRTLTINSVMEWVQGSVLRIANSALIDVKFGATVDLKADGSIDFLNPSGGTLVNLGTLKKSGGLGSSFIDVAITNPGTLEVSSGTMRLTRGGDHTGATFNTGANSTIEFDGGAHTLDNTSVTGSGSLQVSSNTITVNAGGLSMAAGTNLNLDAGTITGSGEITTGSLTWNKATISGSGNLTAATGLTIFGADARLLNGRNLISKGAGVWSGSGNFRLSNNAQFINDTTATLDLQSDANFQFFSPNGGSVVNNGTYTKSVDGLGSSQVPLDFTNNGILNVADGKMVFTAALNNTTTGTLAGNGTIDVTGATFTNNGNTAPGASAGALNITGNFAPSASSVLDIEIGGITPGTEYDQLNVSQTITMDGTVNISLINNYAPQVGDEFQILTYGARSGQFPTINDPSGDIRFIPIYSPTGLSMRVITTNVAPVANADSATIDEDNTVDINVLANDVDGNGDPMSIVSFTQPVNGTVSQVGDSLLRFQPVENDFGIQNFTYKINDGNSEDSTTVKVTINAVNDDPVISPDIPDVVFKEDSSASLDLDSYASDVESDTSALVWDALVIDAQAGLGVPAPDQSEKGGTSNAIEVDVTDLTVSIDPTSHVADFSSTADTSGIFTVVFTVGDPQEGSDTDTITVTVTSENDPHFVSNPIADVAYDEDSGPRTVVSNMDSVYSDPDPDQVLSYSTSSDTSAIQASVVNDSLRVNFTENFNGSGVVTVSANDGSGLIIDDQFTVTVNPVNDAPLVSPSIPNIIFQEDSSSTLDLDGFSLDVDNDTTEMTWSSDVIAAANIELDVTDLDITIDPVTHVATFSASPDSTGIFTVVFTVEDPDGLSDTDTITVTVDDQPSPSVLNPIADQVYGEDSGPRAVVADLDSVFFNPFPSIPLSFSAESDNSDIQVFVTNNTLEVDFTENYHGAGLITVTATGDDGAEVIDDFSITVSSINDLPILSGLPASIIFAGDSTAELQIWDFVSDIETADSLMNYEFNASNDSLARNYDANTGVLTLFAQSGFAGTIDLGVVVDDGDGGVAGDTISVTVNPLVGLEPVAGNVPQEYSLSQNYPNPFNPNTTISFQLPEASSVQLTVYSVLGQKIRTLVNDQLPAGVHQAVWDGLSDQGFQLSSGIYIYRLETPAFQKFRKMILLK